jgi:hypothetical protein
MVTSNAAELKTEAKGLKSENQLNKGDWRREKEE